MATLSVEDQAVLDGALHDVISWTQEIPNGIRLVSLSHISTLTILLARYRIAPPTMRELKRHDCLETLYIGGLWEEPYRSFILSQMPGPDIASEDILSFLDSGRVGRQIAYEQRARAITDLARSSFNVYGFEMASVDKVQLEILTMWQPTSADEARRMITGNWRTHPAWIEFLSRYDAEVGQIDY